MNIFSLQHCFVLLLYLIYILLICASITLSCSEALASVLFMHTSRIVAVRFMSEGTKARRLAVYWLRDTPGFHSEVKDATLHYRIIFSINLATDQGPLQLVSFSKSCKYQLCAPPHKTAKFRNTRIRPRRQNAAWYARYLQGKSKDVTGDPCPPWRTGNRCSQRVCWFGVSDTSYNDPKDAVWGPFAGAFGGKHAYKECSGRGTCDRYTGECKCRPDFTGKACETRKCVKACSGHGMCLPQDWQFMQKYASHHVPLVTNLWDLKRFQVCVCDRGYHGLYCEKRFCPRGDDLLTMNEEQTGPQDDSVQRLRFIDLSIGDYFFLTFTDQYNGRYNTEPIRYAGATGEETRRRVQHALEGLPNLALPTVSIYRDPSTGDIFVKFTDPTTTNVQQLIECTVYTKEDIKCKSGVQV